METDIIGVGFGPANIALAIALEELEIPLGALFVEQRPGAQWQPGMLLDGSDIQHHPARDLALPRNPRSRYTFFNYLVEEGRLFEFLNLGLPFPLRKDYARYVTWAGSQFTDKVRFETSATGVHVVAHERDDPAVVVTLDDGTAVRARVAVLAAGRPPYIPHQFRGVSDPRVFHFTHYLERVPEMVRQGCSRIVVIGGSQSAVELVLDLGRRFPDVAVTNIIRGFGYRQKDLSPFSGEVYYPQFVDYYFAADDESKRILDRELRYTNYSSADIDVVQALYTRLYEQRLDGAEQIRLVRNTEVVRCDPTPEGVRLTVQERHLGTVEELVADAVVLATGFQDLTDERGELFLPPVLESISADVARTPSGRAVVGRDYRLGAAPGKPMPPIYLNGICETTHGMGDAGSFSLLSLRAATIANSLYRAVSRRTGAPRAEHPKQREGVRA